MDFSFNEEQTMLKDMARKFCENNSSPMVVREMMANPDAFDPALWSQMAELGWLGLVFDESHGGAEAGFADLAIICEEMGRVLLPSPFFSTVVMAGLLLMESKDDPVKELYLPKISSGEAVFSLAAPESDGAWAASSIKTTAAKEPDRYVLNGKKMFVSDAKQARHIIVAARTGHGPEDISLLVVDWDSPRINLPPLISISGERQFEMVLDNVPVNADRLIGEENQGWALLEKALPKMLIARSAQMIGAMERVLEMTFDYIVQRKQFGVPIGSFQVLQHHCVDMQTLYETAKVLVYQAAWLADQGLHCAKEAAMAKAGCGEALNRMMTISHQVHGTIAFTEEYHLHLYTRHAKSWQLTLGDSAAHRKQAALEMGLG